LENSRIMAEALHADRPSPEKSSSKKVAANLFILQGGAEPLSPAPVWAEPSQLLIGMWLFVPQCRKGLANSPAPYFFLSDLALFNEPPLLLSMQVLPR
jgi:hypothetical protein